MRQAALRLIGLMGVLLMWPGVAVTACRAGISAAAPPTAPAAAPTALLTIVAPTPMPTETPTPTVTPSPTPTPTPRPVDTQAMIDAINAYLQPKRNEMPDLRIGFAFVDAQTGQVASLDGETAHYALSTFKGPLGAFYLWLVERGQIAERPGDAERLHLMLNESSNPDTACIFKQVGGIPPFNDWLAEQGLSRERNFVFRFQAWGCREGVDLYLPDSDWRYANGDEALGLPGGYALLRCLPGLSCDKVFAPVELANWYVRIYRGEVLNAENTDRWLGLMAKTRQGSALLAGLPDDPGIHAYVKNGFRASDAYYPIHFYNEAGIVETPQGAFALAIFMRGHPEYPGTEVLSDLARIAYQHFVAARSSP